MVANQIIWIVLYGVGLGSISAVVYWPGRSSPSAAAIRSRTTSSAHHRHPPVASAVGPAGGCKLWKRRKSAETARRRAAPAETMPRDRPFSRSDEGCAGDAEERASGSATYLYDLPWYILIGPPGAGKTTALVNSGLKFPLAEGGAPGRGRRHRRHALLRLVVYRGCGADRHRRPLHDAGFGRQDATRRAGSPSSTS